MLKKSIFFIFCLIGTINIYGQLGTFGNTYIGQGLEMSIINAQHSFVSNAILTKRTAPRGYLSFVGTSSYTGATNTSHVNGYVKTYMSNAFTFPIGNGSKLRPAGVSLASATAPIDAAYFGNNPTTDGYSSSAVASGVTNVSNVEYWDINGTTPARITLTWDANSGILSTSSVKIVGWNGSQWVNIPATVDAGASLSAGSITSTNTLAPDTYSVYTLSVGDAFTLAVTNPSKTVPAGSSVTGDAPTETVPTGGVTPYTYSIPASGCVAPSGVQGILPLPSSSNLSVNSTSGVYTFTAPNTAGTYYYCIQVCDNTGTNCKIATYTLTVTCAANAGSLN